MGAYRRGKNRNKKFQNNSKSCKMVEVWALVRVKIWAFRGGLEMRKFMHFYRNVLSMGACKGENLSCQKCEKNSKSKTWNFGYRLVSSAEDTEFSQISKTSFWWALRKGENLSCKNRKKGLKYGRL
jgi:hypothetical protein